LFDKLKAMGAVAGLLKDRDRLRDAGERIKAATAAARAPGESGGGAVRVVATGRMRVESIELTPALVAGMAADDRTRELAGSLIAEAVNDALTKAQAVVQREVAKEAEALGLGDLPLDLGGLLT
jgi:DNA-binding protein YbaB